MKTPLFLLLIGLAISASAQAPRFLKPVRSPEVKTDGQITFRILAPNAKQVSLDCDWGPRLSMKSDSKGVWSLTTDVLPPDIYTYSFVVDGVQVADSANTFFKPVVTGGTENLVQVMGPTPQPWNEGNVPHGVVHRHRYQSSAIGEAREFLVYTPPGYSPSTEYPVLFLLHGVMETEAAWTAVGRAHVILDNLIAAGKAKPMIVVMPLGYGIPDAADRVGDILTGRVDHRKNMDQVGATILKEILPDVERQYRIAAGPKNRAIAGLSMGGAQALYLGVNHPKEFGTVGSFGGAFIMYGTHREKDWFPQPKTDVRLWIACGKDDFLAGSNRLTVEWFKSQSVPIEFSQTSGAHTWLVFRRNLVEFVPLLFK